MVEREYDIKVLNGLIETTLDSADGYSEAAKDAKIPEVKSLFSHWAEERFEVAHQLQDEVRQLGGEPEDEGSVLASTHRVFVKVREGLSRGDKGVIDEVERGEDFIKSKYEKALDDVELSEQVRDCVIRAYGSIKAGHDQARNLKHSFQRT